MFEKIIKDYFSFSRKERIAVLILAFLIILVLFLPYFFPVSENVINDSGLEIVKNQPGLLQPGKTGQNIEPVGKERFEAEYNYEPRSASRSLYKEKLPQKEALFYFDPNKLPVEGWKKLGLRDKTITTIHNYLSRGGKFRTKEDIEKIYGLAANDAERLMPYIRIYDSKTGSKQEFQKTDFYKGPPPGNYSRPKAQIPARIVDINQADTTELIALPGIGSKLAARIVHFREKLGGFYSVDQVSEIYGLPDSTFQKIKPFLAINNPALTQVNINTVKTDDLKQHPYLKWNIAATIVQYRMQHGNYKALEELKNIDLITDEIFRKVVPYLKIE